MKARLPLFLFVLAAFALAIPAPALASIQLHSPPCPFAANDDSLNRLTNLVASRGTNVASYAYALGAAGNRTGVIELNARAVAYSYDPLYRLTGETVGSDPAGSNGAIGYTFDGVGNRLSRSSTISAVPVASHSYTANDWLTSDTYDSNGNTVSSGGMPDTYDFENRLISHQYGQIALVYDGDGNRVKKTASGMSTYYVRRRGQTIDWFIFQDHVIQWPCQLAGGSHPPAAWSSSNGADSHWHPSKCPAPRGTQSLGKVAKWSHHRLV